MKKTIILLAGILSFGDLYAVTISPPITNLQGAGDSETNVVLDNAGALIGSGFIALGVFDISNSEISGLTSTQDLSDAFFNFSSDGSFGSFFPDGGAGAFQLTVTGDTDSLFDGVNTFSGNNAYLVIGNGETFASSTEFLVWDSGVAFDSVEPNTSPESLLLDVDTGTTVIGSNSTFTFDLSGFGGSATEAAFSTAALVPEPSSTLLIGLAGIGMTLRRRR